VKQSFLGLEKKQCQQESWSNPKKKEHDETKRKNKTYNISENQNLKTEEKLPVERLKKNDLRENHLRSKNPYSIPSMNIHPIETSKGIKSGSLSSSSSKLRLHIIIPPHLRSKNPSSTPSMNTHPIENSKGIKAGSLSSSSSSSQSLSMSSSSDTGDDEWNRNASLYYPFDKNTSSSQQKKHGLNTCDHWVRRSVRQPSKFLLNAPMLQSLIEKLKTNSDEVVVCKLKEYIGPDVPCLVIDAILDALLLNSNCQSLYIQNFNEGMKDKQILKLLKVLQAKKNIWCLNIGENYQISLRTMKTLTKGLKSTNVTHIYVSEHTISLKLKNRIRDIIRENRKKHDLHINPNNLDVIIRCTHCWWNPINAKKLFPYLKAAGKEHLLYDKVTMGLPTKEEKSLARQQQQHYSGNSNSSSSSS